MALFRQASAEAERWNSSCIRALDRAVVPLVCACSVSLRRHSIDQRGCLTIETARRKLQSCSLKVTLSHRNERLECILVWPAGSSRSTLKLSSAAERPGSKTCGPRSALMRIGRHIRIGGPNGICDDKCTRWITDQKRAIGCSQARLSGIDSSSFGCNLALCRHREGSRKIAAALVGIYSQVRRTIQLIKATLSDCNRV